MTGLLSTITNGPIPAQGGLTPLGGRIAGYLGDYITGPIHRFYEANNTAVRQFLGGAPMSEEERRKLAEAMIENMPEVGAITYHGTPHRFAPTLKNALGEFDLSKVGSGEGAQVYGHGIYLADSPTVAKEYAETGVRNTPFDGGYKYEISDTGGGEFEIYQKHIRNGEEWFSTVEKDDYEPFSSFDEAIKYLKDKQLVEPHSKFTDDEFGSKIGYTRGPSVYTVDLPDDKIAKMLDWDKPLSQQPKDIKDKLSKYSSIDTDKIMQRIEEEGASDGFLIAERHNGYAAIDNNSNEAMEFPKRSEALSWLKSKVRKYTEDDPLGSQIYRNLSSKYGKDRIGQAQASNELLSNGILGARYLDANSRAVGQGTSNYVVFDPSILNILARE